MLIRLVHACFGNDCFWNSIENPPAASLDIGFAPSAFQRQVSDATLLPLAWNRRSTAAKAIFATCPQFFDSDHR
jgi:hypothetical protein